MGPTSFIMKGGAHFISIADGDDDDLVGTENSELEQAPSSLSLEDHVLQVAWETLVQFTEQPRGTQYMEKFQYCNKDSFTKLNTLFMTSGILGGNNVTVHRLTNRNSKVLSKNING